VHLTLLPIIMYMRSKNRVEHMEASYGPAARKESKRRWLKRKMLETSTQHDGTPAAQKDNNKGAAGKVQ
jgi:hypothetical protein